MATYGEGDPTDNAQDFYDWLQETDVDLSGVKYAVSHSTFLQWLPVGSQVAACSTSPGFPDPHVQEETLQVSPQSDQPGQAKVSGQEGLMGRVLWQGALGSLFMRQPPSSALSTSTESPSQVPSPTLL